MSALISPGLITRLRKIANRGLQTTVTHLQRQAVEENPYGDDTETWVTMGDYVGWLRQPTLNEMRATAGDLISSVGTYRLHLRSEVEVAIGDMFAINDELFTVQDTNKENTYRVFTTCLLRRRQ